jgi:hypothetical protein
MRLNAIPGFYSVTASQVTKKGGFTRPNKLASIATIMPLIGCTSAEPIYLLTALQK